MNTQTPTRACHVCIYSDVDNNCTIVCQCAQVSGMEKPLPVADARSTKGPCGPEARFLIVKGEK